LPTPAFAGGAAGVIAAAGRCPVGVAIAAVVATARVAVASIALITRVRADMFAGRGWTSKVKLWSAFSELDHVLG